MSVRTGRLGEAWPAVVVVAATYVYFLLFAEFALLEVARPWADAEAGRLRLLMGLLALAGVTGSVGAALRYRQDRLHRVLPLGFVGGAIAALAAATQPSGVALLGVTAMTGLVLGGLTVTLATGLGALVPGAWLGRMIGLGTGAAYAWCNLPAVFTASPVAQCVTAAVVAGVGAAAAARLRSVAAHAADPERWLGRWLWIVMFVVLVGLDSAAFYVIQHTPGLREHTWSGSGRLLANAGVHLVAAVMAGWVLDRGRRGPLLLAAVGALGAACALLASPAAAGGAVRVLYPAGVSLYSVALVYLPARSGRPWYAAAMYAIAGWMGSALGIGMAEDLHQVPLWAVALAVAVVVFALAVRARWAVAAAAVVVAAGPGAVAAPTDGVAQGREVYIAEGCVYCHSQYVRPGTSDVARWGPVQPLEAVAAVQPPLLGNRRQGPDLASVGRRRSREWNRLHLIAPRSVSPGSRMPSYAHLFRTGAGQALLDYLDSLGRDADPAEGVVEPPAVAVPPVAAAGLYARWCATCHGSEGRGDGALVAQLARAPPDWQRDPWRWVPPSTPVRERLEEIIRSGLPGTAMAGHEYLTEAEIAGLAQHVLRLHKLREHR